MDTTDNLVGIDLVWWPTLLRCVSTAEEKENAQFSASLNNLATAINVVKTRRSPNALDSVEPAAPTSNVVSAL